MLLLKAYSHNPLTGEAGLEFKILPESANQDNNLSNENLTLLTKALAEELDAEGFPIELAYNWNPQTKTIEEKVYKKRLFMQVEAKIAALLEMQKINEISTAKLFEELKYQELSSLTYSYIEAEEKYDILASGKGVYPGAVSGKLVFTVEELENETEAIWVLGQVSNTETKYFNKAKGLILTKSGITSHAAILAKNLMLPTVLGAAELLNEKQTGLPVSIDGTSGKIFSGKVSISNKSNNDLIERIKRLATERQKIKVLANAETAFDLRNALKAGAQGVGLCRTEHMFLNAERMAGIQAILFKDQPDPQSYQELLKYQEQDFLELFKLLANKEIVIRYLDAPLHEFGGDAEANPMLGFRGARMLIAKPEIIRIQTRAIFSALRQLETKPKIILEMPLVVSVMEIQIFKQIVKETLKEFSEITEPEFAVMLETPRAAMLAGAFAGEVNYLSFGTNDLTQMTFGFSRDDAGNFLDLYEKQKIISENPFEELDTEGVGALMTIAVEQARQVNPEIHISVCGEQAASSGTIKFLNKLGIDSISVSAGKVWPSIFRVAQL